ncbi:hypothetical protein K435DRAFT_583897, partial [Dendrothele bispora CBS 962.96]
FLTNVVATLLIGYREWRYDQNIRRYFMSGIQGRRIRKIFLLLITSGLAYCVLWV